MYGQQISSGTVTTAADGSATVYFGESSGSLTGRVWEINYTKVNFSNGVSLTFTDEVTGKAILTVSPTASGIWCPTQPAHDQTGSAVTAVANIFIVKSRVKLVIASGGNATTGSFVVTIA